MKIIILFGSDAPGVIGQTINVIEAATFLTPGLKKTFSITMPPNS